MNWFLYDRDLRHERVSHAWLIPWSGGEGTFTGIAETY